MLHICLDFITREFDTDGSGSVSFEEFKAMFAQSALGELTWDGIDEDRMARIEQFSKGVGQVHEVKPSTTQALAYLVVTFRTFSHTYRAVFQYYAHLACQIRASRSWPNFIACWTKACTSYGSTASETRATLR